MSSKFLQVGLKRPRTWS